MLLSNYTDLIKHLPFEDQAFETKKETWERFKDHEVFCHFFKAIFKEDTSVIVSRRDLLIATKKDIDDAIFSIILWGYPKGYTRGNTMTILFPKLLESISILRFELKAERNISNLEFKKMLGIDGIGLSTLTKLLYFFNIKLIKANIIF